MNYVALVVDKSVGAQYRLYTELNAAGVPSTFFDGGDTLVVGGYSDTYTYTSRIEAVGARAVADLDLLIKMEHVSGSEYTVTLKVGNGVSANNDPDLPAAPTGPANAGIGEVVSFDAVTTDYDSDDLYYQFDWGNGHMSDWIGPIASGATASESNAWSNGGDYEVKVRVKDIWDATTDWSPVSSVSVGCCIDVRGNIDAIPTPDVQGVGGIDIADLVFLVAYSFQGGPAPACIEEGDLDGSGGTIPIDIADVVYLVAFMFSGGPAPVACP